MRKHLPRGPLDTLSIYWCRKRFWGVSILRGVRGLFENLENVLFDGMGSDGVGWDGSQKCPLKFFILCGYLEHVYIYTCIQNESCRQHSYGFQNLMSSWGSGSKFSNLQQVGDFSILGSKSVTFYFFLFFLWGFKM